MGNSRTRAWLPIVVFGLIFVFLYWFNYTAPLIADDLAWGQMTVAEYLKHGQFAGINDGRYVANILMIVLAKQRFLLALWFAGTFTFILACFYWLLNKRLDMLIILFGVTALVPRLEWAQFWVYNSGYINYFSAYTLLLFILVLFKRTVLDERPISSKQALLLTIFLLPLGIVFQLFSEPASLLSLTTAAGIIIFSLIKLKRTFSWMWSYLIGTILGLLIMFFAGGAYSAVPAAADSYRKVSLSVAAILTNFSSNIIPKMYRNFPLLIIVMLAVSLLTVLFNWQVASSTARIIQVVTLLLTGLAGAVLASDIELYNRVVQIATALIFLAGVITIALLALKPLDSSWWLTLYMTLAGIFLLLPFLFVTPFGERNVVFPQLLFLFVALMPLTTLLPTTHNSNLISLIAVSLLFLPGIIVTGHRGAQIGYAAKLNLAVVKAQQVAYPNESRLIYLEMPYSNWLWHYSPQTQGNDPYFKQMYHLPAAPRKTLLSYSEWVERYQSLGQTKFQQEIIDSLR